MPMLTVDDLARDLKVRNEDLVRELVTMGYQVEGPESPLETDDPAELRARLVTVLPQREVVEQRIKPTVIRRRMKKAPPEEMAEEAAAEEIQEQAAEATAVPEKRVPQEVTGEAPQEIPKRPVKKTKKPEPARIIEMAPKPAAPPIRPVTPPVEGGPTLKAEKLPEAPPQHKAEPRAAHKRGEVPPETQPTAEAPAMAETAPGAAGPEPLAEPLEAREGGEEKPAKKKKKKEKKMQPAQIIGKVELKKEPPPREPERPEPARIVPPAPVRPAEARPVEVRPVGPKVFTPEPTSEEARKKAKKKDKKGRDVVEERVEEEASKIRRRKEVLLRDDLYDDRGRPGRLRGKGKKPRPRKTEITTPKAIKRRVKLPEVVSVSNLAHKMSVKSAEVVQHLMTLGVTASINENIDFDTATIVAGEFGFEVESASASETDLLPTIIKDTEQNLMSRPPVITVMGHVDHGKTSLLDRIRSTHVTDQEAGGITQHIGAYKVKLAKGEVVFLDTPGHEAFTAMRARGAQVTDFVVLVVAADDGVMEQTREAINHARAASVPIIVAVNKIDKPDADRDRVTRELSEHNLIPETWGGDTLYCYVSAKTGDGIDELMDMILLQAELMELRANPNKTANGTVIEARLDKGKGPLATVLVKEGTLKAGDAFVAGTTYGKVRAMLDHEGRSVDKAGPATPVEVQGFAGVPEAGDSLIVSDDEKIARQIAGHRVEKKQREQEGVITGPVSLEDLLARMQEQETKELAIIIKGDVQGSVEALKEALQGISAQEIKVKVIHGGVGAITESDVMLASASGAIAIGFNVRPTPKATQLAEQENIDIRMYTVIYDAIEDVRKAMEGMLAPVEKETVVGRAEVRQTFHVSRIGSIAGCLVVSGKIERSNQVRLLRDNVVVYQGRILSMKRYKDDIKEAQEGYECGLVLENYKDVKVGDVVEAFIIEKEVAKLTREQVPSQ
ncbi:MAG: translation initiation factor IF-2 [Desulfomonile tiedjei]|nr:translation initiation factor IF-2 [Desulfomonile tiedjei]